MFRAPRRLSLSPDHRPGVADRNAAPPSTSPDHNNLPNAVKVMTFGRRSDRRPLGDHLLRPACQLRGHL